jgi:hypothetical protein
MSIYLYRKCTDCHLFVEPNSAFGDFSGVAEYSHLSRGDEADDALDASHEPFPDDEGHALAWWKVNGPPEMRARFID